MRRLNRIPGDYGMGGAGGPEGCYLPSMAHIRLVGPEDARGPLKRIYDAAIARAGRVYNIVRTMSPNPPVLEASMGLYIEVMKGKSGISRRERELVATVVSRANDCFY